MALRIVALVAILAGVAMVAFAAYGILVGHSFAENLASWQKSQGGILDSADFEFRWRLMASIIGLAGTALFISGVALWRRQQWGLLTISAVAIVLAAYPWVLRALGISRYGFEAPEGLDTAVLIGIAGVSAAAFLRRNNGVAA